MSERHVHLDLEVEALGETQSRGLRGHSSRDPAGMPEHDVAGEAGRHVGLLEQLAAAASGMREAAAGEEQSPSPSCFMHGTFHAEFVDNLTPP